MQITPISLFLKRTLSTLTTDFTDPLEGLFMGKSHKNLESNIY